MTTESKPISLSRILAHWAARKPDAVAITHADTSVTWSELEARTNRLARAYQALGVKENDFVTVALPNGIEFFESCFATWKLGATPQPVSAKLPKFERDQIVELCAPALLTGVEDASQQGITTTLPIGYQPDPTLSADPLPERTAESFKAMTSGGSTGSPKLIVSKLPAAWNPDTEYLSFANEGCVLIPGPLYHNGPFSWAMIALFKGNHVVVTTRFDAQETCALIEKHRVDVVYMVPTMMQRIWNLPTEVR
ncbi:MAG: AMP-binding protein, partial [Pseudomonadales bacterium]|nr:AMP-binding protein [Pseudomonadales bacterium]